MKNRTAYTLVEIIVVIALLGIIIAMTIPHTNYFKAIRESLEIKELKRDILFTRNKAIIDSKIYRIKFIEDDNSYTISTGSASESITIKTKHFEHGIKLNTKEGSKTFIFNSNGTTTDSGTIYFLDRLGNQHKLSITPVSCKVNIEKEIQPIKK
ncbi:type II secretion system protein [Tissierella creatinophila]|uniref:Prepilin-type N-terminal cleavage/methylation domain-containing protein n=1 Tax=Tissierella creatinophila DSM 6911 TaxID=1123403 RepID=A0A1U7M9G8_TISCR|nr:type II secretion system protein [Tissierella creatinophila]OLS03926.1 hypothetical protein TICRE_00530 [Tissierella creatinophila DSM 6911]